MPAGPNPAPSSAARLTPGQRWFSFAELALGTFLVIGHNVYHIVPNEVPFLFVLFWTSLRRRDGGWKVAGLRSPDSWKGTIIWALAAAALRISLGELVVGPLTARFFPPQHTSSVINSATGNWKAALLSLLLIWTFAAFGEELGYRGYLLTRAADVLNSSRW